MQRDAATMAHTLKANIQNLQTAFISFADKNLTGPLQNLADLLNVLSEKPGAIEAGIKGITGALIALGTVKLGAGIVSFLANLKTAKSGGKLLNASELAGGGAGIPVQVMNWGGSSKGAVGTTVGTDAGGVMRETGVLGLNVKENNAANFSKGARGAGIIALVTAGVTQAVGAYQKVKAINADTAMTAREKSKARGETIGAAVGTTVGTGAGVIAGSLLAGKVGAVIGTAIAPGVGTAIGGLIGMAGGALAGWLGGTLGKKAGSAIGDLTGAMAEKRAQRETVASPGITNSGVAKIPNNASPIKPPPPEKTKSRIVLGPDLLAPH
jgi:hypothetical protein